MKFRQFGKTTLKTSEIGIGCWAIGGNQFGNSYGPTDDSVSIRTIKKAVELGCTFFDTADVYGHGHSEWLLGMALKKIRKDVLIATKVGGSYIYGGEWEHSNFSEKYIRFALEKSLERLQTDYIDIYQLHNPPIDLIQKAEMFSILKDLKKEGKIRAIGISIHTLEEGEAALKYVDTLQCVFNMLYPNNYEIIEAARINKVGVIAREPLCNGFLTENFSTKIDFGKGDIRNVMPKNYIENLKTHAKNIRDSLKKRRETLAQLAIKYALSMKSVSVVIPGAKTPEQVEENLKASDIPELTDEDLEVLGG